MIFFATYLYPFAKTHGAGWREALARELERGPSSSIPSLRTWAAMTATEDVMLSVSGPCRLAPARSQDAARFLAAASSPDVMIQCDDDMAANSLAMAHLVAACRATRGFVVAPCLQRDASRKPDDPGICNIRIDLEGDPELLHGDGFTLARIRAPGMGLVAIHRDVIADLTAAHPELRVTDDGSNFAYTALFFEMIDAERWLGEDMSFGRRMRARGVPMHALLDADVEHAGRRMVLELDEGGRLAMRVFDLPGL